MRSLALLVAFFAMLTGTAQKINPDFQVFIKNDASQVNARQLADGNYLLFGLFEYYKSNRTGPVAKVDAHGEPVDGFLPLRGVDGIVDMVELPSGKILVTTTGSVLGGQLLRLNADGSRDASFTAEPTLTYVKAAAQSTGKLITLAHDGNNYVIARLNADGTYDNTFTAYDINLEWWTRVVVASDDRIYFSPSEYFPDHAMLYRLEANGQRDSFAFAAARRQMDIVHPLTDGTLLVVSSRVNSGPNSVVIEKIDPLGNAVAGFTPLIVVAELSAMTVTSTGKIIIGGHFNNINSPGAVAELNSDGTYNRMIAYANFDGILGLSGDASGGIFVSGWFELINGVWAKSGMVRIRPDNTVDAEFHNQAFFTGDMDNDIAVQSGGRLLIYGGRKFRPQGEETSGLVRVLPNGEIDPGFTTFPALWVSPWNGGAWIEDVIVQSDDKIVLGGHRPFSDGQTIGRLNPDGTKDNSFQVGTGPTGGHTGDVSVIKSRGSDIYVMGDFDSWNGEPASMLVILDKDGVRIGPEHNDLPPATDSYLAEMEFQSDGKMLVRGGFGFPSGEKELIRLNANGSLDHSFTMELPAGGYVSDIAVDPVTDEIFVIGSYFDGVQGRSVAKYSKDGVWISSLEDAGFSNPPARAEVINDGILAVAGSPFLENYKGEPTPGFVMIDKAGQRVPFGATFNKGTTGQRLSLQRDGLYMLGRISEGIGEDRILSGIRKIELPVVDRTTGLIATAGETSIDLSWSGDFRYASEIVIERSPHNADNFVAIATIANNSTSYNDSDLAPFTTYYYRVQGKNKFYQATTSEVNAVSPVTTVTPSVALPATEVTSNSFVARWTMPSATDSLVFQVSDNDFTTFVPGYEDKVVETATCNVTGLQPAMTYVYRVTRYQNGLSSAVSNVVSVQTKDIPIVDGVTDFVARNTPGLGASLTWSGSFAGAASIDVYVSAADDKHYQLAGNIPVTSNTFSLSDLSEVTQYYFKITGKNVTESVSKTASLTTPIRLAVALEATEVLLTSFVANWEYLPGTDSVMLQVSKENFSSFVNGYDSKFVKSASHKVINLESGVTYQYRVRRLRNGVLSGYSPVITVTVVTGLGDSVSEAIYPNPVSEYLTVALPDTNARVRIVSATGVEIYLGVGPVDAVDMRPHAPGLYLIRIESGSSRRTVKVLKVP